MSEPLKIFCRNCHAKLDVSDLEPFSYFYCPDCDTKIRVPQAFGRYLLEKVCGCGGMSKIYRAIDTKLFRKVAVKILDPGSPANLFEAAQLAAKIAHKNILPVYDCGTFQGRSFLVMRYMECGDLERAMKQGTLPELPVLAKYLAGIAGALNAMWSKNIVHHDIKPSNMLISAGGEAFLGDFDLADIREPGDLVTRCPEWGSPFYMSPERLYGGGEDARGDLYSFGASIYELFSGELPFGMPDDAGEIYRMQQEMAFPSLAQMNPEIPNHFSAMVTRMLDFSPEQRPGIGEVTDALKQLQGPETKKKVWSPF